MLTQEQIEERRTGIGGSEVGIIAGLSPFQSPYELYLEKRGEIAPVDLSEKDNVMLGQLFEDGIAEAYCIVRGRREGRTIKVERRNNTYRRKDLPWAMAHIDRKVVGEQRGVECKLVGAFARQGDWGPDGTDQVPDYMLLQCQWYMGVVGCDEWDLASAHGNNDFRIHTIKRDDGLIADLILLGQDFWECVETGKPPQVDWQADRTTNIFRRLYPGTDGTFIEADEDALYWHKVLEGAKAEVKLYESVVTGAKNHLLSTMGNAAALTFADGSAYQRKTINRSGYAVEAKSYVDFRHTKTFKGASK